MSEKNIYICKKNWQKNWQPELKGNEILSDTRIHLSPQLSTSKEQGMQKARVSKSCLEMEKEDNRKKGSLTSI